MKLENTVQNIINRVLLLNRKLKQLVQIFLDIFIIFISFIISMLLRLDSFDFVYDAHAIYILIFIFPLTIIFFFISWIIPSNYSIFSYKSYYKNSNWKFNICTINVSDNSIVKLRCS